MPEDLGMAALAEVTMNLVNESNAREGVEGSGRFNVSEVRSENRGQFALLRIQRGGEQGFSVSSDGDVRMMGKWSLSHRSL